MCASYQELREGVKKQCNNEEEKEENDSTSTSYSLEASSVESLYKEEERDRTVEKLTKETDNLRECLKPSLENKSPSKIKALEDRITALKLEIETLNCQKSENEQEHKGRHDDFYKRFKENSGYQSEYAFKEKKGEVLKRLDECEKLFDGKIEESMVRVQSLETEVDSLRSQYKNFSSEKEQELESLRVQNQESEMQLNKKTKEASDSLELVESLTENLKQKTANEEGLVEQRDALREQVKELEIKIEESVGRVHNLEMEVESLQSQYENFSREKEHELEALRVQVKEKEMELNKKTKEGSDSLEMLESLTEKLKEKTANEEGLVEERDVLRLQVKELEFKIEESMGDVHNLEMEADYLRSEYKNYSREKEQELESFRVQNQESEMQLNKKSKEAADFLEMVESLTENLKQKSANEEGLIEERDVLRHQVKDLEFKIETTEDENRLLRYETENQRIRISTLESEFERVKRDLSNKTKSLEQKFKSLEIEKREFEGKNDILAATLEERDLQVNKLKQETYSSFRATIKKMGEMVDECRKKSEDSIRIFSRRIRVAEQLHNETREWYEKTREQNEQDRKDSELALLTIKNMTSKVSDTLRVSETFGLRFIECCEAFNNRISIVSCEINFVKDLVKRKNSALVQVKKDFDELVVQLDNKEEEVLKSRQKVLKVESKLRDLEKIVKEDKETMIVLKEEKKEAIRQVVLVKRDFDELVVQMDNKEEEILGSRQKVLKLESKLRDLKIILKGHDEAMIVLKEEKREAIRQLCMWIDYHRGRSEFFKKAFSELVARYRRPG